MSFWKSCSSVSYSSSVYVFVAVELLLLLFSDRKISSSPSFSSCLFRLSSSFCLDYTFLWIPSNCYLNPFNVTATSTFSFPPSSQLSMKLFGSSNVLRCMKSTYFSFFLLWGTYWSFLNFLWMVAMLDRPAGAADLGLLERIFKWKNYFEIQIYIYKLIWNFIYI